MKLVAVLKGGWSRERVISLKTARAVETSLKRLRIPFVSIDVKKNIGSVLARIKPDFCFIALHGTFGEDGGLQRVLDSLKIPYSGSGAAASALCMDKQRSKRVFRRSGIPVIPGLVVKKDDFRAAPQRVLASIRRRYPAVSARAALFVKPVDQGSAIGAARVEKLSMLTKALQGCFRVSSRALVETCIEGRELTVGILGNRVLPVVEIIPRHRFYDFYSKYAVGGSRHVAPAPLSRALTKTAQQLSLMAFRAAGCSVYGRVDLMLSPDNRFYVLEINTIPGMTPTSLLPDAARCAGLHFDDVVKRIIKYSLRERR